MPTGAPFFIACDACWKVALQPSKPKYPTFNERTQTFYFVENQGATTSYQSYNIIHELIHTYLERNALPYPESISLHVKAAHKGQWATRDWNEIIQIDPPSKWRNIMSYVLYVACKLVPIPHIEG